jgi:hypothetical protein
MEFAQEMEPIDAATDQVADETAYLHDGRTNWTAQNLKLDNREHGGASGPWADGR